MDAQYITENPFVRDVHFSVELLQQTNLDLYANLMNRTVAFLTFALNYKLPYGFAKDVQKARGEVLLTAYEAHPERFVKKAPVPPSLPAAVWINKPKPVPLSEEKVH